MTGEAAAAGAAVPAHAIIDGFDEFPFEQIMKDVMPRLAAVDAELAAMMQSRDRGKLSEFVERVTNKWSRGELELADGIESYVAFRARVIGALDDIMAREGRGKNVAIVTSGGPISVALRHALGLGDDITWRTAWVIRNASISEFRYRPGHFTMVAFNGVPHLPADHVTYR
jgi:broad specificity phosphatase PhoE